MFAGFNITDLHWLHEDLDPYYSTGERIYQEYKEKARNSLHQYICEDGKTLNGSQMQADWFPIVGADIFISHSHKDERDVVSLAGWLYEKFELKAFIDSCVWGYSDDLLQELNDTYAILEKTGSSTIYNYTQANISCNHVHSMLSMALGKMIDKTECLFFVNTPNSINIASNIQNRETTFSPWIYEELQMSEIMRKKNLSEYRPDTSLLENYDSRTFLAKSLEIEYDVSLKHLVKLTSLDLRNWAMLNRKKPRTYPLDNLYIYKRVLGGRE